MIAIRRYVLSLFELYLTRRFPAQKQETRRDHWDNDDPGCRIAGYVLVNRVPGNFHITAHQSQESQNVKRTNISHIVHRLTFGEPLSRRAAVRKSTAQSAR